MWLPTANEPDCETEDGSTTTTTSEAKHKQAQGRSSGSEAQSRPTTGHRGMKIQSRIPTHPGLELISVCVQDFSKCKSSNTRDHKTYIQKQTRMTNHEKSVRVAETPHVRTSSRSIRGCTTRRLRFQSPDAREPSYQPGSRIAIVLATGAEWGDVNRNISLGRCRLTYRRGSRKHQVIAGSERGTSRRARPGDGSCYHRWPDARSC